MAHIQGTLNKLILFSKKGVVMEQIANKLTDYILKRGIISKEMIDIYRYGFQCFLELSISTICSIVIAIFLGMLPKCIFFFLLFIPMRSFSGGLHMKTYLACFIGSCLILTSTLLAVKYLVIPLSISFLIYIFTAILIMVIGPVDHPNRKVDAKDNLTFIKKTYCTLLISLSLAIFFIFTNNAQYMFLQAIIFIIIFITSLIGYLVYKTS